MSHGPHDNCLMCSMGRMMGMVEKHPKNCNCQTQIKKEEPKKIGQTTNITSV
ncbi:hypothetical protein HYW44_03280 [Candidatus Daviesbacteria bacterium]|nr:hypothetical protein [Candidatus Daviesbacteria bacterium]